MSGIVGGVDNGGNRNGCIVVIPARYASTRLPGKPLLSLRGKPLIRHVVERCGEVRGVDRVIVATDDRRVAEAAERSGVETRMTPSELSSGTDRVARVAEEEAADVIVNVQGDEPFVDVDGLSDAIAAFRIDESVELGTLRAPLEDPDDLFDPDVVKVVVDGRGRALYFSRSPIPHPGDRDASPEGAWCHVGVYLYRPEALRRWAARPPSPLERVERLEQLRVLEAGETMQTYEVADATPGIDTPEDLERARRLLAVQE